MPRLTFVRVDGLEVHAVPDDVVLVADAVSAQHVAALAGDLERLAARVALDERDHLRRRPGSQRGGGGVRGVGCDLGCGCGDTPDGQGWMGCEWQVAELEARVSWSVYTYVECFSRCTSEVTRYQQGE